MARTPERVVKDQVVELLEAAGAVWCAPIGSSFGKSDQCDFIACLNGRYIEIETKATARDAPTALQARKLRDVARAGGVALVVHKDNLSELVVHLSGLGGTTQAELERRVVAARAKKRKRGTKIIAMEDG